uniref:hypothetical protein n=1 Tax=Jatropha curcas TaxID=180498 RepID=UPI00279F1374|nr:hypothetical protein QLP06_mgp113 [Jatropha curcas]WFG81126.1 hypothetical protein [Jatropha curcas]
MISVSKARTAAFSFSLLSDFLDSWLKIALFALTKPIPSSFFGFLFEINGKNNHYRCGLTKCFKTFLFLVTRARLSIGCEALGGTIGRTTLPSSSTRTKERSVR